MREVKCWCIGSTLVSSCRCCVLVSCVHPVAILRAVFCTICSLSMFVSVALGDHNNNNNICLKSNIQTSSVDYAPRELTHACSRNDTCSRSDTEACDMCYVF